MTTRRRHAFTLLELMLALTITALVGAAIAGMLRAVSTGVTSHRDNRSVMVRASAAQTRLAAYVAPSLACLAATEDSVAVWFADDRKGGTVHVCEVRWLIHDPEQGAIAVHYVRFPEAWTQVARDLADAECAPDTDWFKVHAAYQAKGYVLSRKLVDGLVSVAVRTDAPNPVSARQITWTLDVDTGEGSESVQVTATSQHPLRPVFP